MEDEDMSVFRVADKSSQDVTKGFGPLEVHIRQSGKQLDSMSLAGPVVRTRQGDT